jgi:V/A-type H+-transporting ATPase subunit I
MLMNVPYVGVVLAAGVFLLGHTINILINTLGAFVHGIRLHYVEYFGTFYEGGGREYRPFMEDRKYTIRR